VVARCGRPTRVASPLPSAPRVPGGRVGGGSPLCIVLPFGSVWESCGAITQNSRRIFRNPSETYTSFFQISNNPRPSSVVTLHDSSVAHECDYKLGSRICKRKKTKYTDSDGDRARASQSPLLARPPPRRFHQHHRRSPSNGGLFILIMCVVLVVVVVSQSSPSLSFPIFAAGSSVELVLLFAPACSSCLCREVRF
jgi:hypothetical protein